MTDRLCRRHEHARRCHFAPGKAFSDCRNHDPCCPQLLFGHHDGAFPWRRLGFCIAASLNALGSFVAMCCVAAQHIARAATYKGNDRGPADQGQHFPVNRHD